MLLFLAVPLLVRGQTSEPLDKNAIGKMMDWVSIFTLYSDVELSNKVDLQQYGEAANLATAMMTNPELSVKIAEVREATFVNVYPKGILQSNEWLINKLNEVSNAQYDVLNAPYVTLEVLFTPVSNGYTVTLSARGSSQITNNLADINSIMNSAINGQVFLKPRDAKEKVNKAIFEGLDRLNTFFGQTYAPKIAIRHNDELYLNGQTIETWQRTKETITLTAVNKMGVPLQGGISWTNASGSSANATVAADVKGIKQVIVKSGADQITVNVNVKEFEVSLEDIIAKLVKEILQQMIDENAKQKEEAERDQADDEKIITEKSIKIKLLRATESGTTTLQSTTYLASAKSGFYEEEPGEGLLNHPDYGEYIRKYQQRQVVLETLLKLVNKREVINDLLKPESIPALIGEIKQDMAQISSAIILNLIRSDEAELKNYLTNYLSSKIMTLSEKD